MTAPLSTADLLALIPQRRPFRFVDEILSVDEEGARGRYAFREDEFFYSGHFPDRPLTPGVILAEAMAQQALLPLALHLLSLEEARETLASWSPVLTEVEVEFLRPVRPGDIVVTEVAKEFWRRRKLRARASLELPDGSVAARGVIAALMVREDPA